MSISKLSRLRGKFRHFLIIILAGVSNEAFSQFSLDVEANWIFGIPYNEVRIPAKGGTMFDLAKDLDVQNRFTYRVRANYTISDRHVVSALYAPLTIKSEGTFDKDVVYSGKTFMSQEKVKAEYQFNSYRLTYRYLIVASEKIKFGLGLTGKIREANITLSQQGTTADYPDLGFVPLVNFYFDVTLVGKAHLLLEGDALASKQGRAEDIFLGLTYPASKSVSLKAGARVLEGGADVKRNYNFTWINYISTGAVFTFH